MEYSINVYKSKEKRKEISINKIRSLGIDYLESLPLTFSADEVKIKSIEEIASRYIANILSIQFAFDTLDNASVADVFPRECGRLIRGFRVFQFDGFQN